MPWDRREFYETALKALFVNSGLDDKSRTFKQQLIRLGNYRQESLHKLLQGTGPTTTTPRFRKYLLNCKYVPTLKDTTKVFRCGSSFLCPYCFFWKAYVFCRDQLHPALSCDAAKYVGVTFSQSFALTAPTVPGIYGHRAFDDSFVPQLSSTSDAERIAAKLLTEAQLFRGYEQLWFETDSINCAVTEPQGGFSTTWFDYQKTRNVFTINRLALHLTNTNALQPPSATSLNTRVDFQWHLATDFNPATLFGSLLTFPYGLYDALLLPRRQPTDVTAGTVVSYLFGMRRLMEKTFQLQQSWGSLHARTASDTRRRSNPNSACDSDTT